MINWSGYGLILGLLVFIIEAVIICYKSLTGTIITVNDFIIMVCGLVVFGFASYYYIRYDMWGE